MKTLLSWSGGKDSVLALAALRRDPAYEVTGLLTTTSEQYRRVSMHGVRLDLMHAQARCLGLPLIAVPMPRYENFASPDATACPIDLPGNNTYETMMIATFDEARRDGVEAIAFGDISFVYDGPLFAEPVSFTKGDLVTRTPFTFCDLLPGTAS